VDALREDRGQSLVVAALLLGAAATAVVAVHGAQERLVSYVREQRTGEAAVAAAGAAVADLQLARVRELGRALEPAEIARFATEQAVTDAARSAAIALTSARGQPAPSEVTVLAFGVEIEVHVTIRGRRHIALLGPPA